MHPILILLKQRPRLGRCFVLLSAGVVTVVAFLLFFSVNYDPPYSTIMFDRDGVLLGATIARDGQWRFPPDSVIPETFAKCIVACEDRRFFVHPGIDPVALVRAARVNLRARSQRQGGSTLTMQLMRLKLSPGRRNLGRKIFESLLALRETAVHSKDQTLRHYCSLAPFGGNVVGLSAASWRYFGCAPSQLTWGQAAGLAVLPNRPAMVHPGRNRDELKRRRDDLLRQLLARRGIDSMTFSLAQAEPLPEAPVALPREAPHLLARVAREKSLLARTGPVVTTLQVSTQRQATAIVARHSRALAANGIRNAAAIIAEVGSGQVLAYVGNAASTAGRITAAGDVDIITSPRSTGSILKPFLYGAMVESGELLPRELIADIPTSMGGYSPQNYNRTFDGAVPASMALARSLNVPSVRLLRSYGIERFAAVLTRMGMTTLHRPAHEYGISLVLGGAEGTLWDIAGMYAGLARTINEYRNGAALDTNLFFPLTYTSKGGVAMGSRRRTVIGPGASYLTIEALVEVARPDEEISWKEFSSSRKIAWKTGTSFGFRDGWAVGITPEYVVGVWTGNADGEGRPGLTGIGSAAPILFDVFNMLPRGSWFQRPEMDLRRAVMCRHSGMRPGAHCSDRDTGWVTPAGLQGRVCTYCRLIHVDASMLYRVTSECLSTAAMPPVNWFVLPPSMEWYYRQKHGEYRPLPPYRKGCAPDPSTSGVSSISLLNFHGNADIYVPLELDGKRGRVVFEAAHRDPRATLFWHLDDQYLGATVGLHKMESAPSPGRHVLTVVDESGEECRKAFRVLAKEKAVGGE